MGVISCYGSDIGDNKVGDALNNLKKKFLLISAFVLTAHIEQFFLYIFPKFQSSGLL